MPAKAAPKAAGSSFAPVGAKGKRTEAAKPEEETKTAKKALEGRSRNGGLTPEERVRRARADPRPGQHVPYLEGDEVHCEVCKKSYQKNGIKKWLETTCSGRPGVSRDEAFGVKAAERSRARHEAEAEAARLHNRTAAPGDRRHVLLPDPEGVRCEVCKALCKGTETDRYANRARFAKRPCPGAAPALSEEELRRRVRERDRKRDYLARRRAQEEELQRRAASAGAAPSVPEPDAKRQKTSAAGSAAPRRRGRAAPAAPE